MQSQPKNQGITIEVLDSSGNVVATDSYKSNIGTDSLAQAFSAINYGGKRYKFNDSITAAVRNTKEPKFRVTYTVQNTGNTPIIFNVNAYTEGYYYKNGTTQ